MSGLTRPEPHGTDAPDKREHHALETALRTAHRLAAFGLAAAGFLPHDPAPPIAPDAHAGPDLDEQVSGPTDVPRPEEGADMGQTQTGTGLRRGASDPAAHEP